MRMKLLLENFKRFSTLTEEQLIIEGRIDDARKKYPDLAKTQQELEGESLLQLLIDADPSGNQKYLMGAAKLADKQVKDNIKQGYKPIAGKFFPDDAPEDAFSPWGVVSNVADILPKYHKLMPFIRDEDAKFKDINAIKAYNELRSVIDRASQKKADREAEKAREAAEKQEAIKGTEFVADTPFHKVVRPLTREGSCYFGRETRWCISATQSQNYFDQYTSDGKAFFFLLAKNKNIDPAYKKIAVVIDSDGDFEEYFDATDDRLTPQNFNNAIRQTILGANLNGEIVSFEDDDPYDRDKIMKAAEILGVTEYIDDDEIAIENVVELINDEVEEYIQTLQTAAAQSVASTPARVPFEKYEEVLQRFDFNNMYADLEDPQYSGYGTIILRMGGTIDISDYLEGTGYVYRPGVKEELGGGYEQDVVDAVYNALEYAGFYVQGGEVEQDYDDPERVNFSIIYDAQSDIDDLDILEGVLEELQNTDRAIGDKESFGFDIIKSLEDDEVVYNPEEEKKKEEEEAEAKFRASKDAEYFASQEEREKQMKLALQERKFRIKIKKS